MVIGHSWTDGPKLPTTANRAQPTHVAIGNKRCGSQAVQHTSDNYRRAISILWLYTKMLDRLARVHGALQPVRRITVTVPRVAISVPEANRTGGGIGEGRSFRKAACVLQVGQMQAISGHLRLDP